MLKRSILGLCLTSVMAFSAPVWAHSVAYISTSVNLRAGPREGYPVVAVLPQGATVDVYGCLNDYSWCDVAFDGDRGWVYSDYLDEYYDDRRVPIIQYGPAIGVAIVTFGLVDYWGAHYPRRPWYHDRDHYRDRFGPHGERNRPAHDMPRNVRPGPGHDAPPRGYAHDDHNYGRPPRGPAHDDHMAPPRGPHGPGPNDHRPPPPHGGPAPAHHDDRQHDEHRKPHDN